MIAVGNSISMNAGTPESDIDLFIVTTPDTMWINRIVITFIFCIMDKDVNTILLSITTI